MLLLAFLIVPIVEIFLLIRVGSVLGPWWTILVLVLMSVVGSRLVKREGFRALARVTTQLQNGQLPADEVIDGGLILFAGALMLTPGFLTDAAALALLVPPVRAVVRKYLKRRYGSRVQVMPMSFGSGTGSRAPRSGDWTMQDGIREKPDESSQPG
jgi:UPF0716 protein FxsA